MSLGEHGVSGAFGMIKRVTMAVVVDVVVELVGG